MDEQTVVEGTTGTELIDSSFSDVVSLSDAELEAALSGEENNSEEGEQTSDESQPEQKELQVPAPAEGEEPPTEEKAEVRPDFATKTREQLLALVSQQEAFINRRSSEIGELRKEKQDLLRQLRERAEDIAESDPRTAARFDRAAEEAKRTIDQLNAEEDDLRDLHEGSKLVASRVDPDHLDEKAIRHELETVDKLSPQLIEKIIKDPLRAMRPETYIYMVRSADYKKKLLQLLPIAQGLAAKVKELETTSRTAGSKAISKIEKALKAPPAVNGKSGNSTNAGTLNETDVTRLSDAELEEALRNASD